VGEPHGSDELAECAIPVAAQVGEGRRPAKGNTVSATRSGHSTGQGVPSGLDRERQAARRNSCVQDEGQPIASHVAAQIARNV